MKMKDFPREVVVNKSVWVVRWKRVILGDKNLLGLCDFGEKTIYIKLGQSRRERLSTFWHETLHALAFEYDFTLGHPTIDNLEGPLADLTLANSTLPPPK